MNSRRAGFIWIYPENAQIPDRTPPRGPLVHTDSECTKVKKKRARALSFGLLLDSGQKKSRAHTPKEVGVGNPRGRNRNVTRI